MGDRYSYTSRGPAEALELATRDPRVPRWMDDRPPGLRGDRGAAPNARLLVMFRDPVSRYRSAIARLHRLAAQRGDRVLLASVSDAIWRGFYYQQLRHVLEFFPRDQVLVLQFERCVQDPVGEMERTWRFVGLEPPKKVPGRLLKHKQAGRSTPELATQISEELAERYRDDATQLADLCPEI